jgi:hypothetical protein
VVRIKAQREAVSIGQLAKRWGIGASRVRQLINGGFLPGTFAIPSAGRNGEAVRIPLTDVIDAETRWRITQEEEGHKSPKRRTSGGVSKLEHFPELNQP